MNLINLFKKSFKLIKERNWPHLYVLVDLHGTVLQSTYNHSTISKKFYPKSIETLRLMSKNPKMKLILWTSTTDAFIKDYIELFKSKDIHFDFINENPDIEDTQYASFKDKPYFNVGFDDKFGFNPKKWNKLYKYFKKNELQK